MKTILTNDRVLIRWNDKPRLGVQFGKYVRKEQSGLHVVKLMEAVDGFESGKELVFRDDEVIDVLTVKF